MVRRCRCVLCCFSNQIQLNWSKGTTNEQQSEQRTGKYVNTSRRGVQFTLFVFRCSPFDVAWVRKTIVASKQGLAGKLAI